MDLPVEHLAAEHRFQTVIDGATALADYRVTDGVLEILHTEVPQSLAGRGIAAALVEAMLAHARSAGLKVRPSCSYARSYMQRHPETADLLA